MHSLARFLIVVFLGIDSLANDLPFPRPYSSSFSYPQPPLIQAEFTANYMQQKYDATQINNVVAGFAYFSPSLRKVRADRAFNGTLGSTFFDFSNVTSQGEVNLKIFQFEGGVKQAQGSCSSFTQVPAFSLFTADMLNTTQAAWIGIRHDELYGPVSAWQFLSTPPGVLVTAFLDANNTLVRYDFSAPGQAAKTFATTRFFDIVAGPVAPGVFDTDCT